MTVARTLQAALLDMDGDGWTLELIDPFAMPEDQIERTAYLDDGAHWQPLQMNLPAILDSPKLSIRNP